MNKLEIEYVDINSIKPYSKNSRNHSQKQIEQIKKSIEEFGNNDPVGIWKDTIVEGHGRYTALKELGYTEIPIIRLDHLTDEERKAYTIVHNKLTDNSEWEYDILNEELEDLVGFDMEEYGFEFVNEEYEHEVQQELTQKRVSNILNLADEQFEGVGYYDIPPILPVKDVPEVKEWIGFNYVLSDTEPEGKGVHFFIDDYQFERLWDNPDKYVEKLKQYAVVCSPDFSPYGDMPLVTQLFNHYRKHWVGRYLQSKGVNIIPTIRCSSDERSLDWYLEGEPEGGVVMISSMWTSNEETKKMFEREYNTMYERLKPTKVFMYGKLVEGLEGNIEQVQNFTSKRWGNNEEGDK